MKAVLLYGVLASGVAASGSGIGVRMALGAAPTRIFRMVASRAAALTAAGAALGSVGWMAMQSAMRSVAFGVSRRAAYPRRMSFKGPLCGLPR